MYFTYEGTTQKPKPLGLIEKEKYIITMQKQHLLAYYACSTLQHKAVCPNMA